MVDSAKHWESVEMNATQLEKVLATSDRWNEVAVYLVSGTVHFYGVEVRLSHDLSAVVVTGSRLNSGCLSGDMVLDWRSLGRWRVEQAEGEYASLCLWEKKEEDVKI
jgi:hypothetical protein